MMSEIKSLKTKHDALIFIKRSNELLTKHDFYDANITHSSLIEEGDVSRDEIVLGFDGLEPTVILHKNDIKALAQAVGLKVLERNGDQMSIKHDPLAFVQNGHEQDLGEYADTTRNEIQAIRTAHEELSGWGDLAIGCAWGDYSQDELDVNWCDWLVGQRVEEFLAFIAKKQPSKTKGISTGL